MRQRIRIPTRSRFVRAVAAAWAAGVLGLVGGAQADDAGQREARIKAALVFKIVKFVEWPAGTLAGATPVRICTLGDSAVVQALAVVDGKPVRDRSAQVLRLAGPTADASACHVLYVAPALREVWPAVQAGLRGRSVLTVSDAADFARRGGMIGLGQEENRVTFQINLRAARDAGLAPAAPLLELAQVIE